MSSCHLAHTRAHTQGWPEPYTYGLYTVFPAGKSPTIRPYTGGVYIRFWPTLHIRNTHGHVTLEAAEVM